MGWAGVSGFDLGVGELVLPLLRAKAGWRLKRRQGLAKPCRAASDGETTGGAAAAAVLHEEGYPRVVRHFHSTNGRKRINPTFLLKENTKEKKRKRITPQT